MRERSPLGRATVGVSDVVGPAGAVTLTPAHRLLLRKLLAAPAPVAPAEMRVALWGARAPFRDPGGVKVQVSTLRKILKKIGSGVTITMAGRRGYELVPTE